MSAEINADTPTSAEVCARCGRLFGPLEDRYWLGDNYPSERKWACANCDIYIADKERPILGGQGRTAQDVSEDVGRMEFLTFIFLGTLLFLAGFALGGWLL